MEKDGKALGENPTKIAILEAQQAFAGLADELGLNTEEDVVNLCKEVRKQNTARHA